AQHGDGFSFEVGFRKRYETGSCRHTPRTRQRPLRSKTPFSPRTGTTLLDGVLDGVGELHWAIRQNSEEERQAEHNTGSKFWLKRLACFERILQMTLACAASAGTDSIGIDAGARVTARAEPGIKIHGIQASAFALDLILTSRFECRLEAPVWLAIS